MTGEEGRGGEAGVGTGEAKERRTMRRRGKRRRKESKQVGYIAGNELNSNRRKKERAWPQD